MFRTFEKEVEQLTGRTVPMTVKDILVGRAVKQSLEDGIAIGELKALEEKLYNSMNVTPSFQLNVAV